MKADYFRYIFQNTRRGVIHTASSKGISGSFCLSYLCSDGEPVRAEDNGEERFLARGEEISVMVLENLHPIDLKRAADLLKENRVRRVFLPYKDKALELPELAFAENVQILEEDEEVSFQENGWDVWIKCLDDQGRGTLALKHGPSKEMKKQSDCVMTVKPIDQSLHCSSCVNPENHSCAMRCCLYNDFTTCKGHNGKEFENYVTGVLLLGNVNLEEKGAVLRECLKEQIFDIRMTAFSNQSPILEETGKFLDLFASVNERLNRYYLVSEDMNDNEKLLKAILKKGPRHIPILKSDDYGLCISGIFPQK